MKRLAGLSLPVLLILSLFSCRQNQHADTADELGTVHFNYSGSEKAMHHFTRGLKLLHNFEYDDAAEAFVEAQKIDSGFVMAYWGEAMTYNHPLWRQQDYEKGVEAIEKLGETPEARAAKAQTDLERDFLRSVEIMYGQGSKYQRDSAYSKHLEQMYRRYPGTEEVAAFYALSLLGAVPVGRDVKSYEKSAAIVQGILEENPDHPGALHYLIHSYDDPDHAIKAIQAAQKYSVVAADATHALHMPSHIFVAVGMWDEVVSSNIASWEASVRRMKEKKLDNDARSYHAFHWLMYGLLQQGKFGEAGRIMNDMKRYTEELPSKTARDYLVGMKGNYLIETGDWDSEIAGFECETDDLNIVARTAFNFMEGWKAWRAEDARELSAVIAAIEKDRKSSGNLVSDKGIPMCASGSGSNAPNKLDIDQSEIMEMELRGLLAALQGKKPEADAWFQAAAKRQSTISYVYGPPTIIKPSWELYGEWLLEQGRPEEAMNQFDIALEKGPKRTMALRGKLQAAKALEKTELVSELEAALSENLKDADNQEI